jgi:carboxypeptidase family protein
MKRSIGLVLLLLMSACPATVVTTGGGPPPRGGGPPPPPGREEPRMLTGRVFDAATGKPINRAAVDVTSDVMPGKMTVQTDESGHYRTEPIPSGEFVVRCRAAGYEAIILKAHVDRGTAVMDCAMKH